VKPEPLNSNPHELVASAPARSRFRAVLLAWFDRNQRALPWRENRSPYRVWLSEIMLQQTRVNAVLEHYREFLDRFPDVAALAAAPLDSVLAAWSGLGYYRRARALHHAARVLVNDLGGQFPSTAAGWRELPGIGRYTAAAIASIAFGERCAVVDGNVERVLSRLLARELSKAEQWNLADSLLSASRPGDFNEAMMELGAVICTPQAQQCSSCPVARWCLTPTDLAAGLDHAHRSPASQRKKSFLQFAFCRRGSSLALVRRSSQDSKMAGMWDLPPAVPVHLSNSNGASAPLLTVRHSITITDYVVTVHNLGSSRRPVGARWVPVEELRSLPLTGLARKILQRLKVI
jgi:A/G-specific adenine glycosylase